MSRNTLFMRTVRLAALVAGLAVLALSIVSGLTGRAQQIVALDHELATEADQLAEMSDAYFDRARAIDLVVANDPVFADFYTAPGSLHEKFRAGGPLMKRINAQLAYLQTLYPTQIGEACFIDRSGAEIARTVRGVPAAAADLSPDESRNPFFAPTFALPEGQVYQARAYESPDTKEWVISNSTVVPGTRGRAILHFEVTLDSFRTAAKVPDEDDTISIVDARTGDIWVDSRSPQQVGAPLGRPHDHSLHGVAQHAAATGTADPRLAQQTADRGITTIGDRRLAYRRLASGPGNANTWLLVVSTPQARAWRTAGATVPIAVNVSTRCLLDTAFPDTVLDLLTRHELPTSLLHLEITESSIMAIRRALWPFCAPCTTRASGCPSTTSAPATRRWRTSRTFRSTSSRSIVPSSRT